MENESTAEYKKRIHKELIQVAKQQAKRYKAINRIPVIKALNEWIAEGRKMIEREIKGRQTE